jgi:hypothetical protein
MVIVIGAHDRNSGRRLLRKYESPWHTAPHRARRVGPGRHIRVDPPDLALRQMVHVLEHSRDRRRSMYPDTSMRYRIPGHRASAVTCSAKARRQPVTHASPSRGRATASSSPRSPVPALRRPGVRALDSRPPRVGVRRECGTGRVDHSHPVRTTLRQRAPGSGVRPRHQANRDVFGRPSGPLWALVGRPRPCPTYTRRRGTQVRAAIRWGRASARASPRLLRDLPMTDRARRRPRVR